MVVFGGGTVRQDDPNNRTLSVSISTDSEWLPDRAVTVEDTLLEVPVGHIASPDGSRRKAAR